MGSCSFQPLSKPATRPDDVWNIACRALSSTIIIGIRPCPIRPVQYEPLSNIAPVQHPPPIRAPLTMLPLLGTPSPAHRLEVVVVACTAESISSTSSPSSLLRPCENGEDRSTGSVRLASRRLHVLTTLFNTRSRLSLRSSWCVISITYQCHVTRRHASRAPAPCSRAPPRAL